MVGLFFFGWDKMSRLQHFTTTLLMALGTSLSALWILVANGWMQNPVGAEFNYDTMRMEMVSFAEIFLNPDAQNKFVHTVSAGYVTGASFVLGISAWYLLKGRDVALAKEAFMSPLHLVLRQYAAPLFWVMNLATQLGKLNKPNLQPWRQCGKQSQHQQALISLQISMKQNKKITGLCISLMSWA